MEPTGGVDEDNPNFAVPGIGGATPNSTPTTVSDYLPGRFGGLPTIQGLRLWKPMENQLTAYQMNTGDLLVQTRALSWGTTQIVPSPTPLWSSTRFESSWNPAVRASCMRTTRSSSICSFLSQAPWS